MPGARPLPPLCEKGQTHGSVRRDRGRPLTPLAKLLIAMVEGYASLAKNAQDPKIMKAGIRNIVDWLRVLAPVGQPQAGLIASVPNISYIPTGLSARQRSGEAQRRS